jgi:hypothetical protein
LSAESVTFVVERNADGEEYLSIYYDRLPTRLTRTVTEFEKQPIILQVRLDTLPNAEWWLKQSFNELCELYTSGMLQKMIR